MNTNPIQTDPGLIARRLGVSEELVRRLQARGVLRNFALREPEIRTRLYEAQLRRTTTTTDLPQVRRR